MLRVCQKPSCHKWHSPYLFDTQKDIISPQLGQMCYSVHSLICILLLFISLFNSLDHLELLPWIKMKYGTKVSITFLTWRWLSTLWFHFPFFIFSILIVRITSSTYALSHGHFPKHKHRVMPLTALQFATHVLIFQLGKSGITATQHSPVIIIVFINIICASLSIFPQMASTTSSPDSAKYFAELLYYKMQSHLSYF